VACVLFWFAFFAERAVPGAMTTARVKLPHERLAELWPAELNGARVGAVMHPASVLPGTLEHIVPAVLARPGQPWKLCALFGPQHGLLGQTQDNMIEWEVDDATRKCAAATVPVHSLYGATRVPTQAMLAGLDALVVDLQDVGSRYYTFVWTMVLCMEAAADAGLAVVVLDRPNPLGGALVEGPVLEPGFESFVGLHAGMVIRHGLTIGEIALLAKAERPALRRLRLHVLRMDGWRRDMLWRDTGLPWVLPSPNMPTVDTAAVYPGTCLLEATTISEGRGTTKPFEIVGAAWANAERLKRDLDSLALPGCLWRTAWFEPTFHKYRGQLCSGVQLHVTDPATFRPVLAGFAVVWALRRQAPVVAKEPVPFDPNTPMPEGVCGFKAPPYEYVYDVMPFDILSGGSRWRLLLEADTNPLEIAKQWAADEQAWLERRQPFLLY